ncbi:MAG: hypothetical protein Q9220_006910 [cf. Caloplaca sp. 1 TL-2023]
MYSSPHAKILTFQQEAFLSVLAVFVKGLTPWTLFLFLKAKFQGSPFTSGPEVCKILSHLFHNPGVSHGALNGCFGDISPIIRQYIPSATEQLKGFLIHPLSVDEIDIRTVSESDWTVFEQMKSDGLMSLSANTRAWDNAQGITFGNKLRHQLEDNDNVGKIIQLKSQGKLAHFVAFVALSISGETAFRLAEIIIAIWGTTEGSWTDNEVYNLLNKIDKHYHPYYSLLKKHGEAEMADYKVENRKYRDLYTAARNELELNIGTAAYQAIYEARKDIYQSDMEALRAWNPEDRVKSYTIYDQMGLMGVFNTTGQANTEKAAELRPVAQQIAQRKELVSRMERSIAPCPTTQ